MARSPKSTILLASLIAWGGMILVALIAIYGPHGPARHPKMVAGSTVMMGVLSFAALKKMSCSKLVIGGARGTVVCRHAVGSADREHGPGRRSAPADHATSLSGTWCRFVSHFVNGDFLGGNEGGGGQGKKMKRRDAETQRNRAALRTQRFKLFGSKHGFCATLSQCFEM